MKNDWKTDNRKSTASLEAVFYVDCKYETVDNIKGAYLLVLVDESGLAPESYELSLSFLHTYSAFYLFPKRRRTGAFGSIPQITAVYRAVNDTRSRRLINAFFPPTACRKKTDSLS